MSTTALIKEVNNAPIIFNVDNLQDQQNLENLQAIKMPESMANEVFGNNIRYADNTTCVITENQGNPDFPFNVQFDSSKIPAMPQTQRKLTDSYISGLGMPSGRLINIGAQGNGHVYTAPYSGYLCVQATSQGVNGWVSLNSGDIISELIGETGLGLSIFLPVAKGKKTTLLYSNIIIRNYWFVKAVGE